MNHDWPLRSARGIALVVTLLAIALFSALGLGLALSSSTARLTGHNHDEAVALLNAAESGLELAARDVSAIGDWNRVLDGSAQSTAVDGPAAGPRKLQGGAIIDLTRLTNQLTCERDTTCSDAQLRMSAPERPWGPGNPRWRLFVHSWLPVASGLRPRAPPYVIVWLGDDARETDGNPAIDGGGAGQEGRYVLRARAEAFGSDAARRAIEAEFVRLCRHEEGAEICLPGVRIQSWRVVGAVP